MDDEYVPMLLSNGTNCCGGEEESDKLDGEGYPGTGPLEYNDEDDTLDSFALCEVPFGLCFKCIPLEVGESVSGLTLCVARRPARKRENSFGPCLSSTTTSGAPSRSTASWTSVRNSCRRSYEKYFAYFGRSSLWNGRCCCELHYYRTTPYLDEESTSKRDEYELSIGRMPE